MQDLRERIHRDLDSLRQDPRTVRRAVDDMRRRCQLCLEKGGGHMDGLGQ